MLRSMLFALAVLSVGLAAQSASAQSFSFGIGTGGYGHHDHHHHGGWGFDYHDCYHDCWHPHYYPSYVYVQPAPVVRERVTYVERAPAVARVEPPVADTLITVQNGAGRGVAVTFLIDAQDVALRDGEQRSFTGRGTRVVEFDRGGDFGTRRYDLSAGDYEFVVTAEGWDLVRKTAAAASTAAKPSVRKNSLPTVR